MGVHSKNKKAEFNTLDKLLSEDLGLSVSNIPSYSPRVCAKCALKVRNVVGLVHLIKAKLNTAVADDF